MLDTRFLDNQNLVEEYAPDPGQSFNKSDGLKKID